ncbi:MAG: AAA family ATPase [Noviherbaspirillum sp.]
MTDMRITVVSPRRHHLDDIAGILQAFATVTVVEGSLKQLGMLANQAAPDLLIVDGACEGRAELEPLERMGHLYPNMSVIVMCQQQSPDFLLHAMRAGVREVLPSPVNAESLKAAVERIRYKMGLATSRQGKILAFTSCKGGTGTTLLAANLAYALAAQEKKVALIDMNLQFGDALMFLSDQDAPATLSDIARGINRLDPAFLASSMVNVTPQLGVLAAPEDPAHGMEVKPDHVDAMLKLARNQYDFVVLDLGRVIDAHTIKALDLADQIFVVLQTTLPFVRSGKRLIDLFRSLDYPPHKINLVVNRYKKGGDIGLAELEQAIGSKVQRTIPNHYEAAVASVNQGAPIVELARNSSISKALQEWSEALAREPEQESASWLSRVFKRA